MLKYYRGDVMNILICDDNTAFAMQLQKDINEYFHNPNMITNVITDHFDQIEGTYDVIFMDIELNDKNGIEIAKYHKDKHNCLVIFTSSHENLVFNTFQVEPFQFIRKNHYDYDKIGHNLLDYWKDFLLPPASQMILLFQYWYRELNPDMKMFLRVLLLNRK